MMFGHLDEKSKNDENYEDFDDDFRSEISVD